MDPSTIRAPIDSNRRGSTRRQAACIALAVLTIVVGLATRKNARHLPRIVGDYAPDALWAVMIYWLIAAVFPRMSAYRVGLIALAICYLDEISQLYHASWIDAIRRTTLGGLVLGFGFLWSDIVCYTVGVAAAMSIDLPLRKRSIRRPNQQEKNSWREQ